MEKKYCAWCGKEIITKNKFKKFCCEFCERKNCKYNWDNKRKFQIHNNGIMDKGITLQKLISKYNNICYICGKPCDLSDYKYKGKWFVFGKNYPTIDHVVPLNCGGTHTWNNINLAHMYCNCVVKQNNYKN